MRHGERANKGGFFCLHPRSLGESIYAQPGTETSLGRCNSLKRASAPVFVGHKVTGSLTAGPVHGRNTTVNHKLRAKLNFERENSGIAQAWRYCNSNPCQLQAVVLHEGGIDRVSSVPASDLGLNIRLNVVLKLLSALFLLPRLSKVGTETTATSSSDCDTQATSSRGYRRSRCRYVGPGLKQPGLTDHQKGRF